MLRSASVETKSPSELAFMREAGRIVAETLRELAAAVGPGVSTRELDALAAAHLRKRGARPAFLGYRGYPATLCASVNEEVVHGIPRKDKILREGDIVGLDLGCVVQGYYGDGAVTVGVGRIAESARRLLETTRLALEEAVAQARPGARLGDIGAAVERRATAEGFSVVREFVGHGIGRALHEEPQVPNFGKAGTGLRLRPGVVLAIEPMLNVGGAEVRILDDHWTAVTRDGSLSAHFEHTVAVTENGPQVLTAAP